MPVTVRLYGPLRKAFGSDENSIELKGDMNVATIVRKLSSDNSQLAEYLIDPVIGDQSPNSLILLNGVEINNLEGFETMIPEGAELVLLSVTHGG